MDTGNGRLELVEASNKEELEKKMKSLEEKFPKHGGWFREGETLIIKGSVFRVKRIKPTEIVLKLETRALQLERPG